MERRIKGMGRYMGKGKDIWQRYGLQLLRAFVVWFL